MKKHLLILSVIAMFLSGCSNAYRTMYGTEGLGVYSFPELKQLKGRHISEIQQRIDRFAKVEIGTFSNKYYLQNMPREVLSANRSCNFYGCWISSYNYSSYGDVYFITDKDGFITSYEEYGDYIRDYRSYFKDLIVLDN